MKLINEKIWINLESYLDMESFFSFENQISYNLAKNAKYIETSYTPCYSLFDRQLDGYHEKKIEYNIQFSELGRYEINWYTKLQGTATLGNHLKIRENKGYPYTYKLKGLNEYTFNLAPYSDFKFLFDWIDEQNCFLEYGRTLFWINEPNQKTAFHTDYGDINSDNRDMFIWLTGQYPKTLLLLDDTTNKIYETNNRALVFNNVNWHCSKGHSDYVSWSLRIDGVFNPIWAEKVGIKNYFFASMNRNDEKS
jgi:hypothetical protein